MGHFIKEILVGCPSFFISQRHKVVRSSDTESRGSGGLGAAPSDKPGVSVDTGTLLAQVIPNSG